MNNLDTCIKLSSAKRRHCSTIQLVGLTTLLITIVVHFFPVTLRAADPNFTAEQNARLDEATKLNSQVMKLIGEGKYKEGLEPARKAVAIRKEILGDKNSRTANSLC